MEENKKFNKSGLIIIAIFAFLAVISFIIWQFSPMRVENIPYNDLRVMVAETKSQQIRGLSNRELEDFTSRADAMYFSYPSKKERVFWMKDMNFPIDIVWLSGGRVVKIEANVMPYDENGDVRYMYSRPFEVDGVLEFPAGGVDLHAIYLGTIIEGLPK